MPFAVLPKLTLSVVTDSWPMDVVAPIAPLKLLVPALVVRPYAPSIVLLKVSVPVPAVAEDVAPRVTALLKLIAWLVVVTVLLSVVAPV